MFEGLKKRFTWFETAEAKQATKRHTNHSGHVRFAAAKQNQQASTMFDGGGLSVDETLRSQLEYLRKASRKAGEDNGYLKRYFGLVQTHVVGEKGFTLQMAIKLANGEEDTASNKIIEDAYTDWSQKGTCEVSGKLSRVGLEDLIAKTVAQDGDVIIRHIYDESNPYGYSVQIIEADYLDASLNTVLKNGNRICMGCEVDAFDRPVAYHLLSNHPGDSTWAFGGRKYIRVPADEIDLPFVMWRPGQKRGIPWAHAALLDMHHINEFRGAAQVQARFAASNMAVYERDPDQEAPEDDFNDEGEFLEEFETGGTSTVVPPGYKMRETNFQGPGTDFPDLQKANLRSASSGLEAGYNVIGNDYEGVSYSSLRMEVLEDRDHWKRLQRWMIDDVCNRIFKRWLASSLLRNALPGLNAWDKNRLCQPNFQGRRWMWVDPLKDEQAAGESLKNYTGNPMKILSDKGQDLEQFAQDWETYLDKMEPIMKRANALKEVMAPPPTTKTEEAAN